MYEHYNKFNEGFTAKYNVNKLVYLETTTDPLCAIKREKQLKNWHRDWKINLITKFNPKWDDLAEGLENVKQVQTLKQVQGDLEKEIK